MGAFVAFCKVLDTVFQAYPFLKLDFESIKLPKVQPYVVALQEKRPCAISRFAQDLYLNIGWRGLNHIFAMAVFKHKASKWQFYGLSHSRHACEHRVLAFPLGAGQELDQGDFLVLRRLADSGVHHFRVLAAQQGADFLIAEAGGRLILVDLNLTNLENSVRHGMSLLAYSRLGWAALAGAAAAVDTVDSFWSASSA